MSANDPAGSPGGADSEDLADPEDLRELIRLAERNFRRTRESERHWPETVVAFEQSDRQTVKDALAAARIIDYIFELGFERFRELPRPQA